MEDWTEGNVADIGYTFGYYNELNPQRVKLAFLNAGLVCPEFGTACELGFGQGLSTNLHAAASITQWYGTDFNPSQAGFAQELANSSATGAKLYDESFDEFSKRDLPEFDYIGLHGIWSWISDENRQVIVDFIRKKLKVGGVLYISYNTMPGWGSFAPMRHLMTQHAEVFGTEGRGIVSRIDGALGFASNLLGTSPAFLNSNPLVADRIEALTKQNRHYLAHEYFNRDWHPMYFSSMHQLLDGAKLQYACSAHYLDHVDAINLSQEHQTFLKEIPDLMFRESVRDFIVNQTFRRDYWVKGLRKLTPPEKAEGSRLVRVLLTTYRSDVKLQVTGSLGQANLTESIYTPILDALSDYKVKTLGQLERELEGNEITFTQLTQAMMLLVGAGYLNIAQDESTITNARRQSDKLNTYLLNKARAGGDISYLASPVTGGGIPLGRFQQLFVLAYTNGKRQPAQWAQYAWKILTLQGQKLLKDGNTLESEEENMAELTAEAEVFFEKQLQILKSLQIL